MAKIKSLEELRNLKNDLQEKMKLRERSSNAQNLVQVKVAMATCGIASGAKEVMEFLINDLESQAIEAVVTQTGCMGYCYAEPTIEVTLPGEEPIVFGYVNIKKAKEIVDKYIKTGELVDGIIPPNYVTSDNL